MTVPAEDVRTEWTSARHLFRCVLEEQPTFLVPSRHARGPLDRTERLTLSPASWRSWSGAPNPIAACPPAHPTRFAGEGHTVWIEDAHGMALPFQTGGEYRDVLDALAAGRCEPAKLPPRVRSTLQVAGVLVDPDRAAARRTEWLMAAAGARTQFAADGVAALAGLLHPYHLGALRRYMRFVLRTGEFLLGDGQSARRYITHNEPVLRFFHEQLTIPVAEVVGEPIRPSYLYVGAYQQGADLPRHTDREQCEFTITMLVDYSPEPVRESSWPLYIELPGSTVEAFQGIGDALLFRGRTLPHYRQRIPEHCTSTSVFFHYVPADFGASLD
jgi:hypothetical protein